MKRVEGVVQYRHRLENVLAALKATLKNLTEKKVCRKAIDFLRSVILEVERMFGEEEKAETPVLSQVFEQARQEKRVERIEPVQTPAELLASFKSAKEQYDLAVQDLNYADADYIPAAVIKITAAQMRCDILAQEIKKVTGLDVNPIARSMRERTLRVYDSK